MDAGMAAQGLSPWLTMPMPDWAKLNIPPIDYQEAYYWAAPKKRMGRSRWTRSIPKSCASMKSWAFRWPNRKCWPVSRARAKSRWTRCLTRFRWPPPSARSWKRRVIFRSISEAIREYPELVKKWLGRVVPMADNYFAALNCAVFSDGTFVYVPEGVRCPMGLSTYFRINAENTASSNAR
jgi:Fe-S cluster assembly protein SufB